MREFTLIIHAGDVFGALIDVMPRKIRERIADLEAAGFTDRGGKGSHRNYTHPRLAKPVTIWGKLGDDSKQYQERAVQRAIEEARE